MPDLITNSRRHRPHILCLLQFIGYVYGIPYTMWVVGFRKICVPIEIRHQHNLHHFPSSRCAHSSNEAICAAAPFSIFSIYALCESVIFMCINQFVFRKSKRQYAAPPPSGRPPSEWRNVNWIRSQRKVENQLHNISVNLKWHRWKYFSRPRDHKFA